MVDGRCIWGAFDISCTIKHYALKLVGDSPDAAHMVRARTAILERGGAARSCFYTHPLAMYDQFHGAGYLSYRTGFAARWFPFHLSKVSYWSRP